MAFSPSVPAQGGQLQSSADVVQPSGPWRMDNAAGTCDLRRDYETGERSVTLQILRAAGPGTFDIALAGPGLPKLSKRSKITVRVDPQGLSRPFEFSFMKVPKPSARAMRGYDIDASLFSSLAADQQISFADGQGFQLALNLSGARAAFAAMQTCYEDLLRSWTVDPAQLTPGSPNALDARREGGNPGVVIAQVFGQTPQPVPKDSWVSWNDYPSAALREERGGTVVMALSVNATGSVEACRVVVSSGFEPLDQGSCQTMIARARYAPATDHSGAAKPSTAIERIRWIIPSANADF
jgi:TonB family protein